MVQRRVNARVSYKDPLCTCKFKGILLRVPILEELKSEALCLKNVQSNRAWPQRGTYYQVLYIIFWWAVWKMLQKWTRNWDFWRVQRGLHPETASGKKGLRNKFQILREQNMEKSWRTSCRYFDKLVFCRLKTSSQQEWREMAWEDIIKENIMIRWQWWQRGRNVSRNTYTDEQNLEE